MEIKSVIFKDFVCYIHRKIAAVNGLLILEQNTPVASHLNVSVCIWDKIQLSIFGGFAYNRHQKIVSVIYL